MTLWIILGIVALFLMLGTIHTLRDRAFQRRHRTEAIRIFQSESPERRERSLRALIESQPSGAAARYLHGVVCLRTGRVRDAARSIGASFHRDCDLESAAMLTFACLKARDGADTDIVQRIMQTWEESNRPSLPIQSADREIAACLSSTTRDPPGLSEIGALIWNVVGPPQQVDVEKLLQTRSGRGVLAETKAASASSTPG